VNAPVDTFKATVVQTLGMAYPICMAMMPVHLVDDVELVMY
jgi:hypothetical protein